MVHECGAYRIIEDVPGDCAEGLVCPFRFAEDMIVGLRLEAEVRCEEGVPRFVEQVNRETLVAGLGHAAEQEVPVVGHQAVGWTDDAVPAERVAEQLAQAGVVQRFEPALATALDGHAPVNDGPALVKPGLQAWQAAEYARGGAIHNGGMATRFRERSKAAGRMSVKLGGSMPLRASLRCGGRRGVAGVVAAFVRTPRGGCIGIDALTRIATGVGVGSEP